MLRPSKFISCPAGTPSTLASAGRGAAANLK